MEMIINLSEEEVEEILREAVAEKYIKNEWLVVESVRFKSYDTDFAIVKLTEVPTSPKAGTP